MLVVEHDMSLVFGLCERVQVLVRGAHDRRRPAGRRSESTRKCGAHISEWERSMCMLTVEDLSCDTAASTPSAVSPDLFARERSSRSSGQTARENRPPCLRSRVPRRRQHERRCASPAELLRGRDPGAHQRTRCRSRSRAAAHLRVAVRAREPARRRVRWAGLREAERETGRVLERFPALATMKGRQAGLLSGGQQQQLAIARALMADRRSCCSMSLRSGSRRRSSTDVFRMHRRLRDDGLGDSARGTAGRARQSPSLTAPTLRKGVIEGRSSGAVSPRMSELLLGRGSRRMPACRALQYAIDAVSLGSLYALFACGMALMFERGAGSPTSRTAT